MQNRSILSLRMMADVAIESLDFNLLFNYILTQLKTCEDF